MPSLINLVLWGIPLLVVVEALLNFIAWVLDPRPFGEKIRRILRGGFMSLGFIFVTYMEQLVAAWPALGVYGPGIMWALTAFLVFAGFLDIKSLLGKAIGTFYKLRQESA